MGESKKPPEIYYSHHKLITVLSPGPETFNNTILTPIYSCLYTHKDLL